MGLRKCGNSKCPKKDTCQRYSFKGFKGFNIKMSLYPGGATCNQYIVGNKWTL